MANEVNANIQIGIDSTQALASLKTLQNQISSFNKSVIASNAAAVAAQKGAVASLASQIGATKQFSTSIVNVESSVSRLGNAIDKNRLSLGQYFKYGIASSKNFGSVFKKEHIEMTALAEARVKRLQTQYIALGAAQNGVTKAMAVRPLNLFNADAAVATQRQQLFNKLLHDGSTSVINFGKNTQWAGRQLMVGFTVPLTIFGGMAAKVFKDLEAEAINFKKVYGDIFTTEEETQQALGAVQELSKEFTKYGIAVKDTMALAGVAAQAGLRDTELLAATTQATRLATLGQMEQAEAMRTVISMQTAFKQSNEELGESVDFLNIIENQTVLSLQDVAGAIPRVAPVIQGMGGDVKDLAVLLVAMREGGVSAAEGANALKNSLARLVDPTSKAIKVSKEFGINLEGIVERNRGQILPTIMELAKAMESLEGPDEQKLLATVFGKFQYARIGALFKNIRDDSSQAARAMDLVGLSTEELAEVAEKELGVVEESISTKFTASVEKLKLAIAPIGEIFLKIATPIINLATTILAKFDELSPGVKQFATIMLTGVGIVTPVLIMLIGLFGNFIGQAIKGFSVFNNFFNMLRGGGKDLQYLSNEELDAAAAASSLEGKTNSLTGALNVQRAAVDQLSRAYRNYVSAASSAASGLPQGFRGPPTKMATGGMVGGVGNKDTEPALLTPGEFVINADASKKFAPLLAAINNGEVGKYAKGKVPFNVGGESISLDILRQSSMTSIQKRIDDASKLGSEAIEALARELRGMADEVGVTAAKIDERIRSIPELKGVGGEVRYGAPTNIQRQTEKMDWSGRQSEIDAIQKEVSQKWRGISQESGKMRNLVTTQASHLQAFDSAGRQVSKDWTTLSNLTPDLGAINNYLNRVKGMTVSAEHIQKITDQTGLSYERVNQEVDKLRMEIHPATQEAAQVLSSLARIDEELSLAAVESGKLRNSLGSRATSGYQATAAAAALEARDPQFYKTMEQRAYMSAENMTSKAVTGARSGQASQSPSKKMKVVGNEFVDGWVQGVQESTGEVVAATQALSEAATQTAASGTSDIRKILKDKLGVGPLVKKEQAEIRRTTALRKAENKEIERKMMLLQSRGASPFGLRERAEAEIARERSQVSAPPVVPANAKMLPIVPPGVSENISNSSGKFASATSFATKEMTKVGGYVKRFGGTLLSGSAKVQGAMFAMNGLIFGASMMDNSLGEMAQTIMPAIFAFQGLTMALPLLSNPIGLAALAIGAVGVGFWLLDKNRKDLQEKIIKTSVAMNGSSKAFDDLSKELGSMKPSARFSAMFSGMSGTEKEQESLTEGQSFLETESGQAMLERAKSLAGKDRKNAIEQELLQSLALEIITPDQARGVARAMSLALKDPMLGSSLVSSIYSYVNDNKGQVVKPIQELVTSIQNEVGANLAPYDEFIKKEKEYQDLLEKRNKVNQRGKDGKRVTQEEFEATTFTEEDRIRLEELEKEVLSGAPAMVTATIGPLIDSSKKLAEAQAYLNIQYREGNIDREKYLELTNQIQVSQQLLAETLRRMQLSTTDVNFSENLKMAALAAGMTEEEFGKMETQARALEGILVSTFGKDATWAKEASNTLQLAMTTGALDAATAGTIPDLLANDQYAVVLNLALEGDDPSTLADTVKLLNQVDMLPQPMKQQILAEYSSTDFASPAEFNTWAQETLTMASYFAANPKLQVEAFVALRNGEATTKEIKNVESFMDKIINNSKISSEIDFNLVNLDLLTRANNQWDSLGKKKNISKIIKMDDQFSAIAQGFGATMAELDALPNVYKQAVLVQMNVVADLQLKLGGFEQTLADPNASPKAKSHARKGQAAYERMIANQLSQLKNIFQSGQQSGKDITDNKNTGGSSGGSATKSWLQQLIDDTKANLALFPKMLNQLKGMGIPEQIIEMIGGGEEGVKRAQELLEVSKEKLKQLIKDFNKNLINEAIKGAQQERERLQKRNLSIDILMSQGMSREEATSISSDSANALAVIAASGDKSGKSIQKLVKAFKELEAVPKFVDPIKKELDEINDMYKAQMLPLQQKIDKQQEIVDSIQEEIEALQDLNNSDQNRIRDLERQKEMIQRQIDDYERLNELDERRVQTLQRQDELRNRESESLGRELEALSDIENKIRESYQERIDALEKVSQVNDQILEQQRQQLGLSQALSEGDIYAATAAAQQMRESDAQFAQQQVRTGLEQSMENAVEGLRTSGGLTREQAEEQINQIKEQSYQTSLLIRDIEDAIYARNQLIVPLKDQQLKIDQQIRDVSDIIYNRESSILKIEKDRLDPQTQTLKNLTDQAAELKKNLDIQSGLLEGADLLKDMTDEQIEAAGLLGSAWHEVSKQIKAAQELAAKKRSELIVPDQSKFVGKPKKYAAALAKYNSSLAAINAAETASANAAIAFGQAALGANTSGSLPSIPGFTGANAAGGIDYSNMDFSGIDFGNLDFNGLNLNFGSGGIMKYAMGGLANPLSYTSSEPPPGMIAGGIAGNGSRDSVPAMLTPGEYVIRKAMVDKYGTPMFDAINQGAYSMPRFNTSTGLEAKVGSSKQGGANIVAPMYNNYSVNVSVSGSNSTADEIANKTIMKIKQMQETKIRSGRGY